MAALFICPQDNQSFPTHEALKEHKLSGHVTRGETTTNQEMNPEFLETLKAMKEAEQAKANTAKNLAPDGTELKLPTPKPLAPIRLTYLYEGDCPNDRTPISTLELDIKETHFVIAVCLTCKDQLASREAPKLINDIIAPEDKKTK